MLIGLAAPLALPQTPPAPDNTKMNKHDPVTADQAKDSKTDRELMQKIRKEIVNDKSLSTYAHNVKIIAEHGKVTLKGPVHSQDEAKAIEAKAAEVAGPGNVTNDLTIKGDKMSR